jgi:hypothetical protein
MADKERDITQVNVQIERRLWRLFKAWCAAQGITIRQGMAELLEDFLRSEQ